MTSGPVPGPRPGPPPGQPRVPHPVVAPGEETGPVPVTGHPEIDQALQRLAADLGTLPLADHHDRLAEVQAQLHQVLDQVGPS